MTLVIIVDAVVSIIAAHVVCWIILDVFFSERKDRRRKHSDEEHEIEEDYEQRLSKRRRDDDDDSIEVRSLLPIKCKEMGVIRRTVQICKREFNRNISTVSK